MAGSSVPYQPVPTVESQGSLGGGMSVRSTPNDMGAQLAESETKAGDTGFELAQKQQGMINETLMANADASLAAKVGQIRGEYLANTGLAAQAAYPKYQADLETARQEARANLPPAAQRGFDMLSVRSIANHIADGSVYAASQLKQAHIESGSSIQNDAVRRLADPTVASDPTRVGESIADIKWGAQMQMDENHPGLKTDPETGVVSFDESKAEGVAAKAQFQQNLDALITQGQVNRFNTLSKQDPIGAYKIFQEEKNDLPKMAQVQIDASLQPKVFNAHVQGTTGTVLSEASQAHQDMLFNPSSSGSNANNLGNVKTPSGAAAGTADFVSPATPTDGVILTANNLRSDRYQGKTISQIATTWTGESPEKAAAWANNVSTASGISKDSIPDLNDPKQLAAMMKGIAVAEKSPKDQARFTDDVITQGVQASLSGQHPNTTAAAPKSYATNPDGSPLTQADYYKTHSLDVYTRGDAYAEQQMPGDLQFKHAVHASLEQYMNTTIQNQTAQYKQDNMFVQRALNGEFTKGKRPTTQEELSGIPGVQDVLDRVQVNSPEYAKNINGQLEANTKTPKYFSNVNFGDPKSISTAAQLAIAESSKSGNSINKEMWSEKDAAKFNDQWSALPLTGDKEKGTIGKLEVLRNVRDAAGPYAANVFSALNKTYPNAAYAAAIPDDKTASEILMGDQRITEDKNKEIPLPKVDEEMQAMGYDKVLLPQQYDQVRSAARSIFASRFSSGQNLSTDDIDKAVTSALGGTEKVNYQGKGILTPVGVTGSQMDKFLSDLDNNDIVTGMNNAQMAMTNSSEQTISEMPRGKGGVTFQVGQTPFTLQTIAPGTYMVMQPNGDPYPAPNIRGGKMIVKFNPDTVIAKKPAADTGNPGNLTDMGV